jgi:hypothetical protein
VNSSSIYKGVSWHKKEKRWESRIGFNNKVIYIGRYLNEKEAALAYNSKAVELFGEYAYLNQIEEDQ